jgi:hypothetical protein
MPNWCECDLRIEGPRVRVEEFLKFAEGEGRGLDFNRLIPYPEHFAELDRAAVEWERKNPPPWSEEVFRTRPRDGYNQGGYEWCIKHWGTKWNTYNVSQSLYEPYSVSSVDGLEVEINFDTAWSPPRPVIERASELFPELRFDLRYFERGAAVNGLFVCEGGKVLANESGAYFGNRGG